MNASACGARVPSGSRVEHLDDHVRRVDHLEQLRTDPPRLPGVKDVVARAHLLDLALNVGVARLGVALAAGGDVGEQLGPLARIALDAGLGAGAGAASRAVRRRQHDALQLRPLALRLAAKGGLVGLAAQQVDAAALLAAIGEQAHRQFAALDEHRVRVTLRLRHLLAELGELLLPDHAGVAKPPPVGLHARMLHLAHGLADWEPALDDLALLAALHLCAVHVQPVDRLLAAQLRATRLRLGASGAVWIVRGGTGVRAAIARPTERLGHGAEVRRSVSTRRRAEEEESCGCPPRTLR